MSLTPLPTPPSTSDPANFATRADALVLALANMVAEINGGAIPLTGGTVSTLHVTGNAEVDGIATGVSPPYILVTDEKAANTNGGTFTAGAWQTRTLNTKANDAGGFATLVGTTQVTLAAGTYTYRASAPGCAVNAHKIRLANVTDAAYFYGTTEFAPAAATAQTSSVVTGRFTYAAPKTFEIQHYCQTTAATIGFGSAANFGVTEVYAQVEFWKES